MPKTNNYIICADDYYSFVSLEEDKKLDTVIKYFTNEDNKSKNKPSITLKLDGNYNAEITTSDNQKIKINKGYIWELASILTIINKENNEKIYELKELK